jgi:hypothetical protein
MLARAAIMGMHYAWNPSKYRRWTHAIRTSRTGGWLLRSERCKQGARRLDDIDDKLDELMSAAGEARQTPRLPYAEERTSLNTFKWQACGTLTSPYCLVGSGARHATVDNKVQHRHAVGSVRLPYPSPT